MATPQARKIRETLMDGRLPDDECIARAVDMWPAEVRHEFARVLLRRIVCRVLGRSGVPAWELWAEGWLDRRDRTAAAAQAAADAAQRVVQTADITNWPDSAMWADRARLVAEWIAAWTTDPAYSACVPAWGERAAGWPDDCIPAYERRQQIADALELCRRS